MRDELLKLRDELQRSSATADEAAARIDADEYGRCQSCDEEIPAKRLEVDPTALYCIQCASEQEQGSS